MVRGKGSLDSSSGGLLVGDGWNWWRVWYSGGALDCGVGVGGMEVGVGDLWLVGLVGGIGAVGVGVEGGLEPSLFRFIGCSEDLSGDGDDGSSGSDRLVVFLLEPREFFEVEFQSSGGLGCCCLIVASLEFNNALSSSSFATGASSSSALAV